MNLNEAKLVLKEKLENEKEYTQYHSWIGTNTFEAIKTILKELEKVKRYKDDKLPDGVDMVILTKDDFERNIEQDYISKDIIKEKLADIKELRKIEVYKDEDEEFEIIENTLQELLEENE